MYQSVNSCIINNGYCSEFIQIGRGIRQGCPLSSLLFIITVEALSREMLINKKIQGIMINNHEIKITQLADDTTLLLKDTH